MTLTKNIYEIVFLGYVFQAAFDFDAPGPRKTTQKSKHEEKHNLCEIGFSKIEQKLI